MAEPRKVTVDTEAVSRDDMDGTQPSDSSRSSRRTRTLTRAVSSGVPVRYGVHSIQNLRPEMEDAHRAVLAGQAEGGENRAPLGSWSYFAVFDGHGGAHAAEFAGERLHSLLAEDCEALSKDPCEALRRAVARTEEQWLSLASAEELMDGTTAAVALVDKENSRVVVGNVGDSEILLGSRTAAGATQFEALTKVHHLKRSESEAARITAAGGRVWRGRLGHPKINPQVLSLSISRAIGDLFFKDEKYTDGHASGLIAEPHIASVEVGREEVTAQFLLIGCDGLWDTVTYDQAAEYIFRRLGEGDDPQAISEGLVHLARDAGSSDNITVMVVLL
mmetsp:Transcript_57889/g.152424  ORF Transcript_57889/g.152424 Transcript_57889/m.152424 type:complete len:333 (-) Transcript_57889:73-1071(-)